MEIDGVEQSEVINEYTFDTVGEHTVKYELADPTSIGSGTFQGCTSLTSCTIGSGVTIIGISAFQNCRSLTSIVCNATTAPKIFNDTFCNVRYNSTLYVPIGSSGYNGWMQNANYYLGLYGWTKVEQ